MRINMIDNHWTSGGGSLGKAIVYEDGASPNEVYMRGNVVPAAEDDFGQASGEFPQTDGLTIYSDSDFVSQMFQYIGHSYPTAEEEGIRQEIAQQVLSEL